jgi:DNA polymerase III epsilon subunit-like protein
MTKNNLIFLDTETTGTGSKDRLCQLAYKFSGQEYESLFKPPLPIEIGAMAVSHITNRMVEDKEPFIDSWMHKHLGEILAGGHILVAHNASFDIDMLRREGLDAGKTIDTLRIAKFLDPECELPRYGMQYLRYHHDLEVADAPAHNALGDIRVLERLFDHYFGKILENLGDERKAIEAMIEISSNPVLIRRFNFGKYSGRLVSEIAEEDRNYLQWLLNAKIMAREQEGKDDADWIYTLDHYLNKK